MAYLREARPTVAGIIAEVFMSEEAELDSGDVLAPDENIQTAESEVEASDSPTSVEEEKPVEKTFTQAELNAIAAQQYQRGQEKVRRELEYQRSQSNSQRSSEENTAEETPLTMSQLDEALYRREQARWAQGVGERIESKVREAQVNDPEFGDTYEKLNFERAAPALAIHLDKIDNAADVMKELAKVPTKYGQILTLMQVSPQLVDDALKSISLSIKANKKATNQKSVKPPLDEVKTSNIDTGRGNGPKTVSEWQAHLRKKR